MELQQHFELHSLTVISLMFLNLILTWKLGYNFDYTYYLRLMITFVINPDLDFIFKKWNIHRSAWFHSALLPLAIYWAFRPYLWLDGDRLSFSVLIFLPVIMHLIGDMKLRYIVDALQGVSEEEREEHLKEEAKKNHRKYVKKVLSKRELKEQEENDDAKMKLTGDWHICVLPLNKKRLTVKGTFIWLIGNIGIMGCLIIYFYFFP